MSRLRLNRLLVTGGAGFIGSAFVRDRLRADPEVSLTILDKLTYAGGEENLGEASNDPRVRFIKGDICDPDSVDPLAREADAIVNFAAESHVDRSLLGAGAFVKTDVYGTYVLLEAARKYRHRVVPKARGLVAAAESAEFWEYYRKNYKGLPEGAIPS